MLLKPLCIALLLFQLGLATLPDFGPDPGTPQSRTNSAGSGAQLSGESANRNWNDLDFTKRIILGLRQLRGLKVPFGVCVIGFRPQQVFKYEPYPHLENERAITLHTMIEVDGSTSEFRKPDPNHFNINIFLTRSKAAEGSAKIFLEITSTNDGWNTRSQLPHELASVQHMNPNRAFFLAHSVTALKGDDISVFDFPNAWSRLQIYVQQHADLVRYFGNLQLKEVYLVQTTDAPDSMLGRPAYCFDFHEIKIWVRRTSNNGILVDLDRLSRPGLSSGMW